MEIVALHHIGIPIPKGAEQQALAFYGLIPGFFHVPKPPDLHLDGGVWFNLPDGRQLHLQVDVPLPSESRTHPAFLVNGLTELDQHFKSHHIPTEWDETWIGVTRFKIRDPFGNILEFIDNNLTREPLNTLLEDAQNE